MRRFAAALLVTALLLPSGSAAAANVGVIRVLVARITDGPETFTEADVRRVVFAETDAWVRDTSFGQASLAGDVTPWLRTDPPRPACPGRGAAGPYLEAIGESALPALRAAGYDPRAYDKVAYLVPWRCTDYTGVGMGSAMGLFGALSFRLVAHELGHTLGILVHANRWVCDGGCRAIEYGDPYDVMGGGSGQFNAWEKFTIGWLTNVTRARAPGTYTVDQLEEQSTVPQAFVVTTARNEYWFDHREPLLQDAFLSGSPLVDGVFVHGGQTESPGIASDFPQPNILMPNPANGLDALLPGASFSEAGAFRLTVLAHTGTHVDVAFRWTDTSRPGRPSHVTATRRSRAIQLSWDPSTDRGSGVDRYEVFVGSRHAASVASDFRVGPRATIRARPGRRVVSVLAVDRAGNRSAPARRTFVVPG